MILPGGRAAAVALQLTHGQADPRGKTPLDAQRASRCVNDTERLVEPDRDGWTEAPDQLEGEARLWLGENTRARVREIAWSARGMPAPGKVAIEIHPPRVLASPSRDAIWIEIGHDPDVRVNARRVGEDVLSHRDPSWLVPVNGAEQEDCRATS